MISVPAHEIWLWLAPLLVGLGVSFAATPVAIRAARRFRIIDRPVGLKIHRMPTPLLGGVAVYCAFLIACLTFLPIGGPVRGILAGGAIAVIVGVVDDRISLPPLVHLAGQVVAAIVTVTAGLGVVTYISIPWKSVAGTIGSSGSWHVPALLGVAFTLVWIVGMMNTVNFLDGLDGLSTGVGSITAVLLAWWAAHPQRYVGQTPVSFHHADLLLPVILVGALVGFLPFNWHPAKVFIGDSGAMFVGLSLAAMSILGPAKIGTALLVLSIPVLDVAWAIVRRRLRGKSFLAGDKQHVYHRMLELGMPHTATVISLYALCIALGVVDLELLKFQKLIAFAAVVVVSGVAFIALEIIADRRKRQPRVTETVREAGLHT